MRKAEHGASLALDKRLWKPLEQSEPIGIVGFTSDQLSAPLETPLHQ